MKEENVSIGYDETRRIGNLIIFDESTGLTDEMLSQMVIAPAFKRDGQTITIIGWSLIDGSRYRKPDTSWQSDMWPEVKDGKKQ